MVAPSTEQNAGVSEVCREEHDETPDAALNTDNLFFERFCTALKAHVGTDVYASWFGRLKLHPSSSKSVLRFSVPTAFLKSWINNHYLDLLAEIARSERPQLLKVEILVRSATRAQPAPVAAEKPKLRQTQQTPAARPMPRAQNDQPVMHEPESNPARGSFGGGQTVFGSPLDPFFTFDSFVEGASNRVAFAAAKTIAESSMAAVRFNPLFIHSSVGLGKTHLLQAIANAALAAPEKQRVVYLTAEYFMWKFATAIRDNDALTLRDLAQEHRFAGH
nr:DnaA/Hda family protein [Marinicella sp. W31]MDC2877850.1 DnaA/Hda family protein [Marinicella sp. W31]